MLVRRADSDNSDLYKQFNFKKATIQHPLLFVYADKSTTFLNSTLKFFIKFHKNQIPHKQKQIHNKRLPFNLPIICSEDVMIQNQKLLEFICDVYFKDYPFTEYFQRKTSIIENYKFWKSVFQWENMNTNDISALAPLGIRKIKDYQNVVAQHLQIIVGQILAKTLFRKYPQYAMKGHPQIEEVLYADIIRTIMESIPRSFPDLILRGYFSNLIQFSEKVFQKIQQVEIEQQMQVPQFQFYVLQGGKKKDAEVYKKWNLNLAKFMGIVSVTGLIYRYFMK